MNSCSERRHGKVPRLPQRLDLTNDGSKNFHTFIPLMSWLSSLTGKHASTDVASCAASLLMLMLVDCFSL